MLIKKGFSYKVKLFAYLSLLTVIILIVVNSWYFFYLRQTLSKQSAEASRNTVIQLKNATEIMLKDANRSLMQLALDPRVANFMVWNVNDSEKDIVDIIDFLRSAHSSVAYNNYFSSCHIMYMSSGISVNVLTGRIQNMNDKETFKYGSYIMDDFELLTKARELFQQQNPKKDFKIYNIDTSGKKNIITVIKPINSASPNPEAVLVLTIDASYFSDILNYTKINENAHVFILDKDGKAVSNIENQFSSFVGKQYAENVMDQMVRESGSFTTEIENENCLVSFVQSEEYGWKYIYTIPTKEIYKNIKVSVIYVSAVSLICMFLGIGFSYLLARKLYNPINKLVNTVKGNSGDGVEKIRIRNDIDYIGENIQLLMDKNKNFEELFEENFTLLKNTLLNNLLKSTVVIDEQVWEKLMFYKCNLLKEARYYVCVMGIDDFESFSHDYSERQIGMLQIYQTGIIYEVCNESSNFVVEVVRLNNYELGLIVSASPEAGDETETKERLEALIEKLQQRIVENARYTVTIGVGSECGSIDNLMLSYNEAMSAYGYKVIKGTNGIIHINDIPKVQEWYYVHPVDIEKRIFKFMKAGDREEVFKALDSYFEYAKKNISDYTVIRYTHFHLLDATLKCCLDMAININDVFPEKTNLFNEILAQKSLAAMNVWLKNLFQTILDYICTKKNNKTEDIIKRALDFINENYNSADMSLESVSESMDFSVSYLAKLFKDSTGRSIKEYITERRIMEAKLLLETSTLKVKEIGEQVGYPNTQSFINIFKKYEGLTPGEYHDQKFKKL